jgi:hypothetical protein
MPAIRARRAHQGAHAHWRVFRGHGPLPQQKIIAGMARSHRNEIAGKARSNSRIGR